MITTNDNDAKEQAEIQYSSILEMLAALGCDFDRLQELRDQRDDLADALNEAEKEQAATLEEAREALAEWNEANAEELSQLETVAGDCVDQEDAYQQIDNSPISVELRSDWTRQGEEFTASEFKILLCCGGPSVRIYGQVDEHGIPYNACLEYQDWGTAWTKYVEADNDTLCKYAGCLLIPVIKRCVFKELTQ